MILSIGNSKSIAEVKNPTWDEVYIALKLINKKEGRTFVKLVDESRQCGILCMGSKRALAMEFVKEEDGINQHFWLGKGHEKPIDTIIQIDEEEIIVHLHEVLAVSDAYEVFEFFFRASIIPSRYSLRVKKSHPEKMN